MHRTQAFKIWFVEREYPLNLYFSIVAFFFYVYAQFMLPARVVLHFKKERKFHLSWYEWLE